jgi:hypothetical protein
MTGCKHLGEGGICGGMYRGFGCIQDKCAYIKGLQRAAEEEPCQHLVASYCAKFGKFHCAGAGSCDSHVAHVERERSKA